MTVPMGERVCFQNLPGAGMGKPSKDSTIHGEVFITLNSPSSSRMDFKQVICSSCWKGSRSARGEESQGQLILKGRWPIHSRLWLVGEGREAPPLREERSVCLSTVPHLLISQSRLVLSWSDKAFQEWSENVAGLLLLLSRVALQLYHRADFRGCGKSEIICSFDYIF